MDSLFVSNGNTTFSLASWPAGLGTHNFIERPLGVKSMNATNRRTTEAKGYLGQNQTANGVGRRSSREGNENSSCAAGWG